MTTYTVPRGQGTYADILTALGLGRLLKVLSGQGKVMLRLDVPRDVFTLEVNQLVTLPEGTPPQLYEYIKKEGDGDAPADAFDYAREKERREQFRKWRENNKKVSLSEIPEELELPRPDFSLYSSLVDMLKPVNTSSYAAAYRELASERFNQHVQVALDALSSDASAHEGSLPESVFKKGQAAGSRRRSMRRMFAK